MARWLDSICGFCWKNDMRSKKNFREAIIQVVRYGVVGVINNFLGYLIYLGLTWRWLDPKAAVSLLYPIGVIIGYFGHAKYSFSYQGSATDGVVRYAIAHCIGYGLNILILWAFADKMYFPHQVVQAVAIIVVAGALFILFRFFVFTRKTTISSGSR